VENFRWLSLWLVALAAVNLSIWTSAQSAASRSTSSASAAHGKRPVRDSGLDAGAVANGVYRNKTLGMSCKIPAGWVLRTEEMNAENEETHPVAQGATRVGQPPDSTGAKSSPQGTQRSREEQPGGRVLLAAFSRPPEAKGEDVNGSILIAAESVEAYPGLTEAVQYVGPLSEVAKAQGFAADDDPYEIAIGTKTLVRVDFHKDVGSRVMRQSTLVFLSHGYAVSITVIGGTEDEADELVDSVEFGAAKAAGK